MRAPRYWEDVVPHDLLERILQYSIFNEDPLHSESSSDSEDEFYHPDSEEDDYMDALLQLQLRMLLQEENLY